MDPQSAKPSNDTAAEASPAAEVHTEFRMPCRSVDHVDGENVVHARSKLVDAEPIGSKAGRISHPLM
ncbi:hypothetical protein AtubIFM57258_003676 [Aspergillus tubingensis]|nr:hypothetical protein AtubIFM57258_003676 [Aspergillus tubingensis]